MSERYISDFQIIGSSIKNLKIKNDFVVLSFSENTKRDIDVSHEITNIEYVEDGLKLSGIVLLNIKVVIKDGKRKYNLDLSIEGCFNAPADMGEENFKGMINVNGITSLYSIARGFVQGVTAQTVINGSVLLPMFNVAAYSKDLACEEN